MKSLRDQLELVEQRSLGIIQTDLTSVALAFEAGFVFVAMAMDPALPELDDVLATVKRAASAANMHAERIDDPETNRPITPRIVESLRRAEHVVVDLTHERPSVYFEAGYSEGLGRTPTFVAREGTQLHFDTKDYPVIFFKSLTELEEKLSRRLRGLAR